MSPDASSGAMAIGRGQLWHFRLALKSAAQWAASLQEAARLLQQREATSERPA